MIQSMGRLLDRLIEALTELAEKVVPDSVVPARARPAHKGAR
jgi:hypothetical protein